MKIWFVCGYREKNGRFYPVLKLCSEDKDPVERTMDDSFGTAQEAATFAQDAALEMMKQTPGTVSVSGIH